MPTKGPPLFRLEYQKSPQCGPNASFADHFGNTANYFEVVFVIVFVVNIVIVVFMVVVVYFVVVVVVVVDFVVVVFVVVDPRNPPLNFVKKWDKTLTKVDWCCEM